MVFKKYLLLVRCAKVASALEGLYFQTTCQSLISYFCIKTHRKNEIGNARKIHMKLICLRNLSEYVHHESEIYFRQTQPFQNTIWNQRCPRIKVEVRLRKYFIKFKTFWNYCRFCPPFLFPSLWVWLLISSVLRLKDLPGETTSPERVLNFFLQKNNNKISDYFA